MCRSDLLSSLIGYPDKILEFSELNLSPIIELPNLSLKSTENYVQEIQSRLPDLQIDDDKIYKRTEHPNGIVESERYNWNCVYVNKESN